MWHTHLKIKAYLNEEDQLARLNVDLYSYVESTPFDSCVAAYSTPQPATWPDTHLSRNVTIQVVYRP